MNVIIAFSVFFACGLAVGSKKPDDRIIGGDNALPGEFPYQASLREKNGNLNVHFCGGSVIGRRWILTAAHCVFGANIPSVSVVVGTNKLNSGGKLYGIINYIPHEYYNSQTVENDVAVIQTKQNITLSSTVKIIPLAGSLPSNGVKCVVSGWGYTYYPSTVTPNDLKRVYLYKISLAECRANLTGISVFNSNLCTRRQAGYGVCKGDSGGPLKYSTKQIGIVSFGIPCGKGRPDVYSSVPFFKPWITQKTGVV
ncbi:hypothetical protein FQR65_LT12998 [Abscondita terminalis]|nr:hypothetical protein FQR65_LT12998 [Abscondita terminalis]